MLSKFLIAVPLWFSWNDSACPDMSSWLTDGHGTKRRKIKEGSTFHASSTARSLQRLDLLQKTFLYATFVFSYLEFWIVKECQTSSLFSWSDWKEYIAFFTTLIIWSNNIEIIVEGEAKLVVEALLKNADDVSWDMSE